MQSSKKVDMRNGGIISVYMRGVLSAGVFSVFTFVLMALLITYTSISEAIIPMVTSTVLVISVAMSGMYAGSKLKQKGWLNGSAVGLLYTILILIIGWVFLDDFSMNIFSLYKIMIGVVAGGIGGMIGVNIK